MTLREVVEYHYKNLGQIPLKIRQELSLLDEVNKLCGKCGNPRSMHRSDKLAHHSECTVGQFQDVPTNPTQRGHHYPTSFAFCAYGCGCYRGCWGYTGPEDVNPLGECPCAPGEASVDAAEKGVWLIYFEDADVGPEIFLTESAARHRFAVCQQGWSCHLFQRIGGLNDLDERSPSACFRESVNHLPEANALPKHSDDFPHLCPNCGVPMSDGNGCHMAQPTEPAECCAARKALEALFEAVSIVPEMQNRKYVQLGMQCRAALATPCECDRLRWIFRYTCGHYRGPGSEAGPCVICTERAQLCARLAAMTADRNQWQRLKDGLEEEKARLLVSASEAIEQAHVELRAELATALDREKCAVKILRECSKDFAGGYYTHQWRGPLHAKISAIVSEFDAREGK